MNSQENISKIIKIFSIWLAQLRLDKSLSLFDSSKISENIALKILNEIYSLDLKNLNYDYHNFPAIDLGDKTMGIAFQITTQEGSSKIDESLEKFIKHDLHKTYPKIKILVLNHNKPKYLTRYNTIYEMFLNDDLLDDRDIIREIEKLQVHNSIKFYKILELLENEFEFTNNSLTNIGKQLFYNELIQFFDYCNKQSNKFYQNLGEFSIIRIGEKLLEYQLNLRSSINHMRMKLEKLQIFANPNNYRYFEMIENIYTSYDKLINIFDEEFEPIKKVMLEEVASIDTEEYLINFNKRNDIIHQYYKNIKNDLSTYQNNVYKLYSEIRLSISKNYDV